MTDRDRLILLLEEYRVVWSKPSPDSNSIIIENRTGPRNKGYAKLLVEFSFREDGSFIEMGIYD